MYKYNEIFYQHINAGATQSAKIILEVVIKYFDVKSVLDIGCGQGAWLAEWKQLGAEEVLGVDGDYVRPEALLIDETEFKSHDLCAPLHLDRQFDLVQALEVAEHIPEEFSDQFVTSIIEHGKVVLFSAAVVGQGGEEHINEQPYEYWRDKFLRRNYYLIDIIRPVISGNRKVKPWYRYNVFLFVARELLASLPEDLSPCLIREDSPIPDVSPFWYKLRKGLFRVFPTTWITLFAAAKKKLVINFRKILD